MADTIGKASYRLSTDTAEFDKGLDRAAAKASSSGPKILAFLGGFAGGLAGGMLAKFNRALFDPIEDLAKQAGDKIAQFLGFKKTDEQVEREKKLAEALEKVRQANERLAEESKRRFED